MDLGKMLFEVMDELREGGGVLIPPGSPADRGRWTLDDRWDLDAVALTFLAKVREAESRQDGDAAAGSVSAMPDRDGG